jgi:hypothetical protein
MKVLRFSLILLSGFISVASGQSTFIYDQQSSDEGTVLEGSSGSAVLAQSFSPTLTEVGFIRLSLFDASGGNGGGTLYVTLRGGSLNGPILGTSAPVALPNQFGGFVDFIFTNPVSVTPDVTYYFNVSVQSGSGFALAAGPYNYPRGMEYLSGSAVPGFDLWFREGIIVPEPSSLSLLLLSSGFLFVARKHANKNIWQSN